MTVSGSVSDFDETKEASLRSSIAAVAGVDVSAVTIAITAGSVLITATIAVPATTAAAALQTTLFSALGTAAAASIVLGVIVESAPAITVAAPLQDAPTRMPRPPAPLVAPHPSPPSAASLPRGGQPSPPPPLPPQPQPTLDTIGGSNMETSRNGGGGAIALLSCAVGVAFAGIVGGLLFLRHRRRRRRPSERSLGTSGGVAPKDIVEIEASSRAKRGVGLGLGTVQMAGVCAIEHDVFMATPADPGEGNAAGAAGSSSTVCARAIEVLEVRAGDAGVFEAAVVSATVHKRHAAARLQRWWRRRSRRSKTDRLTDFSRSSRSGASPIVQIHHSHAAVAELSVVPLPLVDATARVVDC